ncbi:hypothetical protein H5410_021250, partial [Solanum commersonii]
MPIFFENFLANPFGDPDLARQSDSATHRSVQRRHVAPQRAKGIKINDDATASQVKATKLPTTSGK